MIDKIINTQRDLIDLAKKDIINYQVGIDNLTKKKNSLELFVSKLEATLGDINVVSESSLDFSENMTLDFIVKANGISILEIIEIYKSFGINTYYIAVQKHIKSLLKAGKISYQDKNTKKNVKFISCNEDYVAQL